MVTQSQIGKRSKRKGASFEIKVAKTLSLWLTEGESKDAFWRSAMSGGRATLGLSEDFGDLVAKTKTGLIFTDKIAVECKNYANLNLRNLLVDPTNHFLFKVYSELEEELIKSAPDKNPMVIFKENRFPACVMLSARCVELFENFIPQICLVEHALFIDTLDNLCKHKFIPLQ